MVSTVAGYNSRRIKCGIRKRRCLSGALGLDYLIVVLAGFVVIAMFQAVQIGMLRSRANAVYIDMIVLKAEQGEIYEKYFNTA